MTRFWVLFLLLSLQFVLLGHSSHALILNLGGEEIVQAAGSDLQVEAYSVPCLHDWNEDGLKDLIVGPRGVIFPGTVLLYLNSGLPDEPVFTDSSYLLAGGNEIEVPGSGCMGACPRVVDWDGDPLADLLVGDASGQISLYLNVGVPGEPLLGAGSTLEVGPEGAKLPVDVGDRAIPLYLDWNEDGLRDLVVGAMDGRIHIFLNSGTESDPDFQGVTYAQGSVGDLVVDGLRSSPVVMDLDEDGDKDLLSGNTNGQILVYLNQGSDSAPQFGDYFLLTANGTPIDFADSPRTRPFVCDWTGDGLLDLITGLGDGRLHLFQGGVTSAETPAAIARLDAPWPNPANPRVHVGFTLERDCWVQLSVYDVTGRHIADLASSFIGAGHHVLQWDARDSSSRELPSGLYMLRLQGQDFQETQKVVVLR